MKYLNKIHKIKCTSQLCHLCQLFHLSAEVHHPLAIPLHPGLVGHVYLICGNPDAFTQVPWSLRYLVAVITWMISPRSIPHNSESSLLVFSYYYYNYFFWFHRKTSDCVILS